jgi:3-oxoacyl-[acyl-carrier protein] reductase
MNKYETIKIGDSAEIKHVVTRADIEKFIDLTGDDNKLHYDAEYAEKTSFKKPVAHGMLGASFISTIIGTKLPGDGALWFTQTLEFILPVRIGDELTIKAEVTKKIDKMKAIELITEIFNQDKQKVTTGVAQVKIVEQEIPIIDQNEPEKKKKKIALIIGATGGIGLATARSLAKDGYQVGIHYNANKEKADKLKVELVSDVTQVHIFQGDITNPTKAKEILESVVRKFGTITLIVNCATIKIPNIKIENLEWEDLQKQIDINIKSNFYLAEAAIPYMKENGYGKLIFITTQYTESTPPIELMPYVVAKYALNGFAKSLAVELALHGIQVNLVSPGMTETDLISDIPEKIRLVTAAKAPLRRLAKPQDVAGAISFLASEKADYITGETIRVNGGQLML